MKEESSKQNEILSTLEKTLSKSREPTRIRQHPTLNENKENDLEGSAPQTSCQSRELTADLGSGGSCHQLSSEGSGSCHQLSSEGSGSCHQLSSEGSDSGRGEDAVYEEGLYYDGFLSSDETKVRQSCVEEKAGGSDAQSHHTLEKDFPAVLPNFRLGSQVKTMESGEGRHEGLVRAEPVILVNNMPQVHKGEYENLVPDNQYYEHLEFNCKKGENCLSEDDGLYSIPEVQKPSLGTQAANVDLFGLTRRFPSIRNLDKKNKKRLTMAKKSIKTASPTVQTNTGQGAESMYAVPRKREDSAKDPESRNITQEHLYISIPGRTTAKKSSSCCGEIKSRLCIAAVSLFLISVISVGVYLMSGNVITLSSDVRRSSQYKRRPDFSNWNKKGIETVTLDGQEVLLGDLSSRKEVRLGDPSPRKESWGPWSPWSRCSANPCIPGETMARSRKCMMNGAEGDVKVCIQHGAGINVEIEPCFCF